MGKSKPFTAADLKRHTSKHGKPRLRAQKNIGGEANGKLLPKLINRKIGEPREYRVDDEQPFDLFGD